MALENGWIIRLILPKTNSPVYMVRMNQVNQPYKTLSFLCYLVIHPKNAITIVQKRVVKWVVVYAFRIHRLESIRLSDWTRFKRERLVVFLLMEQDRKSTRLNSSH